VTRSDGRQISTLTTTQVHAVSLFDVAVLSFDFALAVALQVFLDFHLRTRLVTFVGVDRAFGQQNWDDFGSCLCW